MEIDYLIVGQGLAGSILAWELMRHEQRVLVLDNNRENSASRVAAGLINPVTGQRLVKSTNVDSCLPAALDCYRNLEQYFAQQFFYPLPMLRLFQSSADQDRYRQRTNDVTYKKYLANEFLPGKSDEPIADHKGGFEQRETGYLDIAPLMKAIRQWLEQRQSYLQTNFDYTELQLRDGGVRWRELLVKKVVFCEGAGALDNPWFCWLPFQLCKGDVISLHSKSALPKKIINDGYWLLPVDGKTAKVGATYEWQWRTEQPSETSKLALWDAFQRMTDGVKASILKHQSGIRPTTRDKHPFIGDHPHHKQLAIFNGFGSKGALLIPQYARQFVTTLLCGKPLPSHATIERFAHGKSMVTLAKLFVSEHINSGDVAIDATVGNGYDTEFLARRVGAQGHVYGFDLQQQAIVNTQNRLRGMGLESRVTLIHAGHEIMDEFLDENLRGRLAAIMFNLGYLPGGDKSVQTQTKTTINALKHSLNLLKGGGIITIVTYSGHTGGDSETRDVRNWLEELSNDGNQDIDVEFVLPESITANAPGLIKIIRKH